MDINVSELKQAVRLAEKRAKAQGRIGKIDAQLAKILGSPAPNGYTNGAGTRKRRKSAPKVRAAKRKVKASARTMAMRKLQGKYMGYLRGLKAAEKRTVKATFKKEGLRPAVIQARALAEASAKAASAN